jgi:hypothetical protein
MNASALFRTATSCGPDARVVQGLVSSTGLQRFVRQPLTSGFLLARERPDRCLEPDAEPHKPQESQNSRRELRHAPCELEGQQRDRVLTPHSGPAPRDRIPRRDR